MCTRGIKVLLILIQNIDLYGYLFNIKKMKIFLMQFSNFTAEKNLCRFYITWALCSDMIKVYEVIHAVAHLDGPFSITHISF